MEAIIIIISVIVIVICLMEVSRINKMVKRENQMRKTSQELMQTALKKYFSKIGDVIRYEIVMTSELSPMHTENIFVIEEHKGDDWKTFFKPKEELVYYNSNICTEVVESIEQVMSMCFLVNFYRKGTEKMEQVYIVVISHSNIGTKW